MSVYEQDGLTCMKPSPDIRTEWDRFIASLGEDGLRTLREAGIDPGDPMELNDQRFHRSVETTERASRSSSSDGDCHESYFQKITKDAQMREWREEHEEEDALTAFGITIAGMVIDAFDCSKSREVRFHCDCMRLAIGDPSMGSQKQVCEKYGVSKAMLSWNVRKIQKRLNLPKCIFNGNRTK